VPSCFSLIGGAAPTVSFGDEHELHAGREGDVRLVNGRQEHAMPDLPVLVRQLTRAQPAVDQAPRLAGDCSRTEHASGPPGGGPLAP
jgi:hypothetical protein